MDRGAITNLENVVIVASVGEQQSLAAANKPFGKPGAGRKPDSPRPKPWTAAAHIWPPWKRASTANTTLEPLQPSAAGNERLGAGHRVCIQLCGWLSGAVVGCVSAVLVHSLSPTTTMLGVDLWRYLASAGAVSGIVLTTHATYILATRFVESQVVSSYEALYFLFGTRKPMRSTLRVGGTLVVYNTLLVAHRVPSEKFDTAYAVAGKLLICALLFSCANLFRAVVAKWMASYLHTRAHFERLREALRREFVLWKLLSEAADAAPQETSLQHVASVKLRRAVDQNNAVERTDRGPAPVVAAHLLQKHIRKNGLMDWISDGFTDEIGEDDGGDGEEISIDTARVTARSLKAALDTGILHRLSTELATSAKTLFGAPGTGNFDLPHIQRVVQRAFDDRANLAATLSDTNTVVGTLRSAIGCVLHSLLIIAYLIVFGVDVNKAWLTIASVIVATSVIFGQSLRNAYDSFIFLLVVNAFDVGDTIAVDDDSYVVEHIRWSTTIVRAGNGNRVWIPTPRLAAGSLSNLSRSAEMWDTFKLCLDVGTRAETISKLDAAVREYIEVHRHDFTGKSSCQLVAGEDPMKVRLCISFQYSFNASEQARLGEARHGLLTHVSEALPGLEAGYSLPPGEKPLIMLGSEYIRNSAGDLSGSVPTRQP